jgi:hypothetical protein
MPFAPSQGTDVTQIFPVRRALYTSVHMANAVDDFWGHLMSHNSVPQTFSSFFVLISPVPLSALRVTPPIAVMGR